jgi:hypothetical protein
LFVDALRHEEKAIIGFFFESAFQEHERTVKTEKDEFWNNYYTGSINDVDKKADAFIIINIGRSLQNIGRSLQTSKQNQNNALVDNPETTDATAADKETKAPINLNSNQVATPNQQNDGVKCSFEGMTFDEVISPVKDSETTQTPETPKKEVGKTVPSTAASL